MYTYMWIQMDGGVYGCIYCFMYSFLLFSAEELGKPYDPFSWRHFFAVITAREKSQYFN